MYAHHRNQTGVAPAIWPSDLAGRPNRPACPADRLCARPATVPRNTDIVAAGEANALVVVHHGWLFRYKLMPDGRRTVLNFVLPGDLTGAECRLRCTSPVFLTAATDCVVATVPQSDVWKLRADWPHLDEWLIDAATRESALLARQLVRVARMSAYERIGDLLLELLGRLRAVGLASENSFNLPLTQPVLADALGLTHVHVNRVLQAMKRDDLIRQDCQRITIPHLHRLRDVVGSDDEPYRSPPRRSNGSVDGETQMVRPFPSLAPH